MAASVGACMKKGRFLEGRAFHYAASLLLVQLAGGCAKEAPTADGPQREANAAAASDVSAQAEDGRLIVAFGDSLFAGYGLDQNQGFAPALERVLKARGIQARVINGGISGDTTAAGLQRLAFTLDGLPRKPDLVIVGLGANDMLRGLSPQATRANLDAILTELRKRDIAMMLAGMIAAPNMGPDYSAAFNPIYPELAKKFGVEVYPFFLDGVVGQRHLLLPDGMHPNDRGIDRIVDRIAPVVVGALPD